MVFPRCELVPLDIVVGSKNAGDGRGQKHHNGHNSRRRWQMGAAAKRAAVNLMTVIGSWLSHFTSTRRKCVLVKDYARRSRWHRIRYKQVPSSAPLYESRWLFIPLVWYAGVKARWNAEVSYWRHEEKHAGSLRFKSLPGVAPWWRKVWWLWP